jgi:chromosomal replication initiator protein
MASTDRLGLRGEEQPRRIYVAEIQAAVCERFRMPMIEMFSRRRARVVARPRQVAMYLSRELTRLSLPEIGRRFGDKDHTTVLHACRAIPGYAADDPELAEDIAALRDRLLSDPNQLPLPLSA